MLICIIGDHDFIVAEIKRAVLPIKEIHAVSEVQVYYKDNGLISTKVDILLPPNLTIHQAHAIAGKIFYHLSSIVHPSDTLCF